MDIFSILRIPATPINAPAFPRSRYRFVDREYLTIDYRTDIQALRRVVPAPLTVIEPVVRFEAISMPDVSGLGAYSECGQTVVVEYEGQAGEFVLGMYVDNHPAIASGREASAFPKKWGNPALYIDSDTLVGVLDYGSIRVATATMGYKHQPMDLDVAREQLATPAFMLKHLIGYDGKPRICELVRTQIQDLTVKGAWTGPARLDLTAHALAPLADLPVLDVLDCSHIIADLTIPMPEVVHDYLTEAVPSAPRKPSVNPARPVQLSPTGHES